MKLSFVAETMLSRTIYKDSVPSSKMTRSARQSWRESFDSSVSQCFQLMFDLRHRLLSGQL